MLVAVTHCRFALQVTVKKLGFNQSILYVKIDFEK